jgi:hypothetical protein
MQASQKGVASRTLPSVEADADSLRLVLRSRAAGGSDKGEQRLAGTVLLRQVGESLAQEGSGQAG